MPRAPARALMGADGAGLDARPRTVRGRPPPSPMTSVLTCADGLCFARREGLGAPLSTVVVRSDGHTKGTSGVQGRDRGGHEVSRGPGSHSGGTDEANASHAPLP
ncbi:hypothetical protein GCM10010340_46440 [Streptomyces griseoloalbus]|nr:hypothetical protein GCM10010340_46440 [Streptomyces albaduncus]